MKKVELQDLSEIIDVTETAQKLLIKKVQLNQRNLSGEEVRTMIEDGRLDLDPWFQRDEVWSNDQKIKLVDSFLSNTPIPAIYLEKYYIDDDGFEYFRVVDGKQRISALKSFIEGDFAISYEGQPNTFWKGKKWSGQVKVQQVFKQMSISCVILNTSNCTETERETVESYVFQRWNDSSALTQGEIRHSLKSDLNNLIVHNGLLEFVLGEVGVKVIQKKNRRKEINEILERLVYRFYMDETISHTHPNHKLLIAFHKRVLDKSKLDEVKKEILDGISFLSNNLRLSQTNRITNLNMKLDLLVLLTYLKRIYGKQKIEVDFHNFIHSFIDMVVRHKKISKNPDTSTDDDKNFLTTYHRFFEAFRGGVNGNNQFRFDVLKKTFMNTFPQKRNESNRLFSRETKDMVWVEQKEKCAICDKPVTFEESEADHILEYVNMGNDTYENCQVVCKDCHKEKTKQFMKEKKLLDLSSFNQ